MVLMSNNAAQYKLKPCEMETTIRWDRQERVAHIFTADPFMIRKFDKLCENSPQVWSCVWTDDKYEAKKYAVPYRYIRFGRYRSKKKDDKGKLASDVK